MSDDRDTLAEVSDALRNATMGPWVKHPSGSDPDLGVIEWTILNQRGATVATNVRTVDADLMLAARNLGGEEGLDLAAHDRAVAAQAREDERREWANYIEGWGSHVGDSPFDQQRLVELMRGEHKPFGARANPDAHDRADSLGSADA